VLVGQVHTGADVAVGISVATGGRLVTGSGLGMTAGATVGWGAQAETVIKISSKISEVFI